MSKSSISQYDGIKKYLCGKKRLYGYEIEILVLRNGIYITYTQEFPDSVSDLEKFLRIHNFHDGISKNLFQNWIFFIKSYLNFFQDDCLAILTDKRYHGAEKALQAIRLEKEFFKILRHRLLIGNLIKKLGRLSGGRKVLWTIMLIMDNIFTYTEVKWELIWRNSQSCCVMNRNSREKSLLAAVRSQKISGI